VSASASAAGSPEPGCGRRSTDESDAVEFDGFVVGVLVRHAAVPIEASPLLGLRRLVWPWSTTVIEHGGCVFEPSSAGL
jgi:hypothetical protein